MKAAYSIRSMLAVLAVFGVLFAWFARERAFQQRNRKGIETRNCLRMAADVVVYFDVDIANEADFHQFLRDTPLVQKELNQRKVERESEAGSRE